MGMRSRFRRPAFAVLAGTGVLCAPVALADPPPSLALAVAPRLDESAAPALRRVAYSRTVERIQQGLNDLGYDAGPQDGLFGGTTATAIRRYQRRHDLSVTGQPSRFLLDHILARLETVSTEQSSPPDDGRETSSTRPATAEAATASRADNDLVTDIQEQLRRLGHDVRLSGRLDRDTVAAIRAYQEDRNLLVTGEASQVLLRYMKDTAAEDDGRDQDSVSPRTIARVQSALNTRGYGAGPPDGVMGPSTRAAIRTYQADSGVPVTGTVTVALLERLNAMPGEGVPDRVPAGGSDGDAAVGSESGAQGGTPAAPTWTIVFSDRFTGTASLAATRWERVMGDVAVRDGGLVTRVAKPVPKAPEEIGRELLSSVLGEALGVQMPGNRQAEPDDRAVVVRDVGIGPAFRVEATLSSQPGGDGGRDLRKINLGVYGGRNVASGLRLRQTSEGGGGWSLLRNAGGGLTTLASGPGPDLSDGQRHDVLWERASDGVMTVSVDGRAILRADSGSGAGDDDFDGLSLINGGGTWVLHRVTVSHQSE